MVAHVERDADVSARRLAYVTVLVPTAGFAAAVVYAIHFGMSMADIGILAGMYMALGRHAPPAPRLHRSRQRPALTEADPGGRPYGLLRGLWHGHVGWLFTVRRGNWSALVPELLRDRLVMWINQYYFAWVLMGLLVPAAAGLAITGTWAGALSALLWGGLARIFVLDHVTWGVNSVGHTLGSRPHRTRDNSRNVALHALLSLGGSWHNNHHAHPALAHNRHAFWQIDIIGAVIRALDAAGLVSDVRYPKQRKGAE